MFGLKIDGRVQYVADTLEEAKQGLYILNVERGQTRFCMCRVNDDTDLRVAVGVWRLFPKPEPGPWSNPVLEAYGGGVPEEAGYWEGAGAADVRATRRLV